MKIFRNILIVLIIFTVIIDVYAIFHQGFFYTPLSKAFNISTPVIAFVYMLVWIIKKKKEFNSLNKY